MAELIVGAIPEFTSDEGVAEEVKEPEVQETEPEEEETDTPDEPPASDQPAAKADDETEKALRGLQQERINLLKEITDLRGQRRELKQDQIDRVDEKIEQLEGVHPDDVALVERVLKAKGYITKDEAGKLRYEDEKDKQLALFLEKHPEYKPENDPGDTNWTLLQRELGFFRLPSDPKLVSEVLERAHRGVIPAKQPETGVQQRQRQVATASAGSRGGARAPAAPSAKKSLPEHLKQQLRQGGWSEEEISTY